ncbi:unnamed protein product [Arctia plantaginis]|uniref:Uncharacterized protein n=1 Tax=Arctia plantaginis TaxID=874455 RepID=A0A8S0YUX4_ARCPL|nr:unnamed protein product [Arctia plantaginis]
MSQIEAVVVNQEQLVEEMERLLASFKKTGRDKRTADYIKRKLDALEEYWNEFQANHEQLSKYDLDESPYFQHRYFESAEEVYNRVKLHFKQYLATTPRPSPKIDTDQQQPTTPQPGTSSSDRPIVSIAGPSTKSQGVDSKTTDLLRKQESVIVLGVVAYAYRCVKQRSGRPGAEALATPVRPSSSASMLVAAGPESTRSAPRTRSVKCKCTCDSEGVELNSISVSGKPKYVRKVENTSTQVRKPVFTVSENLV